MVVLNGLFRRSEDGFNIAAAVLIGVTCKGAMMGFQNHRLYKSDVVRFLEKRNFQPAKVISGFLLLFIFLGLFHFTHKIALTITMQPWLIAVDTKVFGNVFMVNFKTGIHKKLRAVRTDQRGKQQYGGYPSEHLAAKVK